MKFTNPLPQFKSEYACTCECTCTSVSKNVGVLERTVAVTGDKIHDN